ncbi:MAG TPA: CRISPR-associated endoribonuclease Cas6 [Ferroplasma sp.]|nr:CRISPR-associated endoribonuclease Cas6 [Ferroplasma sp.]
MRVKFKFYPEERKINYTFNKYDIQGMIYSTLLDAGLSDIHYGNKIKFFSFSDIFPNNIIKFEQLYNMVISSPDPRFIEGIYNVLSSNKFFYLYSHKFNIAEIKKFDLRISKSFITGSPVVLYLNNRINKYFSIQNGDSIAFFLRRLKENAIKKFTTFYKEDIMINHLLFDKLQFHREVSLKLIKNGKEFNIIGSTWYKLDLNHLTGKEIKFYKFLMDAGIGEKNSLGFGFINPVIANGQ